MYNFRKLPARYAAILAAGLRDESRTKMKLAGTNVDFKTVMLASIYDRVNWMAWTQTEGAQKRKTKPPDRVLDALLGVVDDSKPARYDSAEAFEAARRQILEAAEME